MKSEYTKNLQPEELEKLKEDVVAMSDEELIKFRNGFNSDDMGFSGHEGVV